MSTINIEQIDKINAQLESLTGYMDKYVQEIQDIADKGGTVAQKILDEKSAELSQEINEKLNSIRQKIIDIFKEQYKSALEKIKPIEPLINFNLSLDTVVDAVKQIIAIITAPYQPVIEFTTTVIPKVLELSNNIQKIASYQPTINIPNINMPKLDIKVEPITPSDITG